MGWHKRKRERAAGCREGRCLQRVPGEALPVFSLFCVCGVLAIVHTLVDVCMGASSL